MRIAAVLAASAAMLAFAPAASADELTLRGSGIPLGGCRIQDIKSGRVYYVDARGRRQWREVDEVSAIGFDGLDELDRAEAALREGRADEGLRLLLRALLTAEKVAAGDVPRLWVRVRLAQVHAARGEYAPAAGHAAAVFALRDDATWRHLEPDAPPPGTLERASLAQLREALDEIERAERIVQAPALQVILRRLRKVVEPAFAEARLREEQRGAPGLLPPGSTRSGFTVEEILGAAAPARPAPSPPTPAAPSEPSLPSAPVARDEPAPRATRLAADAPQRIDELLNADRSAEALALCERIAQDPGRRRLAQFLFQYGRALASEGRPADAAVMFVRCAVLHESSAFAPPSLIEAARIHRDAWGDTAAARRLLRQAVALATALRRDDDIERAERLLRSLPPAAHAGDDE